MPLPDDWRAFIESLNSHGVEYLVVGAVALAHHAFPRYTDSRIPESLAASLEPRSLLPLRVLLLDNFSGLFPLAHHLGDFFAPLLDQFA
jgi:hypothetical protein